MIAQEILTHQSELAESSGLKTNMNKFPQTNLPIFIGFRCNYSCQHCAAGSDLVKGTKFDPELEEIMSAIPVLAEKFDIQKMISLQGGEPFLYWDEKIIPLAHKLRKYFPDTTINIYTNGHLLGKNIDRFFDLVDQINNVSFTVSRHLMGDLDSAVGQQWESSINELMSHPRIVKIHDDHYHVKDNILANIYFYSTEFWSSYYTQHPNGQIKPHATNDPAKSMKHSCIGKVCSYLRGTKLYKCGRLANLPQVLSTTGQLNDPDWKKYVDYQPLDLLDLNQHSFNEFTKTYGNPISQCDMCNDQPSDLRWKDRTWDLVFHKKNTP